MVVVALVFFFGARKVERLRLSYLKVLVSDHHMKPRKTNGQNHGQDQESAENRDHQEKVMFKIFSSH